MVRVHEVSENFSNGFCAGVSAKLSTEKGSMRPYWASKI